MEYMPTEEQNYNLFRARNIIDILIGDETGETVKLPRNNQEYTLSMPYLSGSKIQSLAANFGVSITTGGSRWQQFQELVDFCIRKGKVRTLINFLLTKPHFMDMWKNITVDDADYLYERTISYVLGAINLKLHFSGMRLKQNGNSFDLLPENKLNIEVPTVKIKTIDRDYVSQKITQARIDIQNGNFDSALTKARTVLEEVLILMLEKKNLKDSISKAKGDLNELFKEVRDNYNIKTGHNIDKNINDLVNGLNKIVTAIGNIRNISSDSHGLGQARYNISDYHALLVVNSSIAVCEFLISVMERNILAK